VTVQSNGALLETLGGCELSNQNHVALLEHLDGVGVGTSLVVGGLVVTIGNIALGASMGIPMMLFGILVPLVMTWQAKQEADRQALRRRPERDAGEGYVISTKSLRRRNRP